MADEADMALFTKHTDSRMDEENRSGADSRLALVVGP
jgi:hypothetical protein